MLIGATFLFAFSRSIDGLSSLFQSPPIARNVCLSPCSSLLCDFTSSSRKDSVSLIRIVFCGDVLGLYTATNVMSLSCLRKVIPVTVPSCRMAFTRCGCRAEE